MSPENYFLDARRRVRSSFQLWALKYKLAELESTYEHPDQCVADPKWYEIKSLISELQKEMN